MMHIHGNSMNINAANLHSAGNDAKAVAAERAAGVRKRLRKSASRLSNTESEDAIVMIGHWLDARSDRPETKAE